MGDMNISSNFETVKVLDAEILKALQSIAKQLELANEIGLYTNQNSGPMSDELYIEFLSRVHE